MPGTRVYCVQTPANEKLRNHKSNSILKSTSYSILHQIIHKFVTNMSSFDSLLPEFLS